MANPSIQNSTFVGFNNSRNRTYYDYYYVYGGGNFSIMPQDYYSDYYPHKYTIKEEWEVSIRGYLTFFVALITIISNILLISVFIFRSSRSPTTILLTSLAISDSVICVTCIPEAIYFNMAKNYKNPYMTYQWCKANHVLRVIYHICVMVSNWLTAVLGVQRLLAVALPFKYRQLCSNVATSIEIVAIAFVAFLLNLSRAFEINIRELPIYTTSDYNESLPSGCVKLLSLGFIKAFGDPRKSSMIFFIFYGLLYHVLPVVILFFTSVTLAYFLLKRQKMGAVVAQRRATIQRKTALIFLILVVFLVAEIQGGIVYSIYAAELDSQKLILSRETDSMWSTISTFISLLSYACNFWIFFLMSQHFRSILLNIFKSGIRRAHVLNLEDGSRDNAQSASTTRKDVKSTLI